MPSNYYISKTANLSLSIKHGDTFYLNFVVKLNDVPVNLSGYTSAIMQARADEYSVPVLSYSSTGNTIDISNLAAGQIVINGSTSNIEVGQYYYDLQLSGNNFIETIVSGKLIVVNDYSQE